METVVSALSLADICIRSYKNADQEIREYLLIVETLWSKIQRQLQLLRDVWPSLDKDYQIHQNSVLQVLQSKIYAANSLIPGLKYATWVKGRLKSDVDDLKEWGAIFDISWFLIIRHSSKDIDHQLQPIVAHDGGPLSTLKEPRQAINSNLEVQTQEENLIVFLPPTFPLHDRSIIYFHNSNTELWLGNDDDTSYLVDSPSNISIISDSCKLAKILQKVEPDKFGILLCQGLLKSVSSNGSQNTRFVLSIPSHLKASQNLRSILLPSTRSQQLDDSFTLAKQLAKYVMFMHSAGFVHKNIRPETIIVMRSKDSNSQFAFLTGFESFRVVDSKTQYHGDELWERNLYHHPTRQGVRPEEEYIMQHDVYSIGVCLLQIGLGRSLVLFSMEKNEPSPSPYISQAINLHIKDKRKKAFEVKRTLLALAQDQLLSGMGRRFTEVVVTCLTCLDKTGNTFGEESEFLDENGILVGV